VGRLGEERGRHLGGQTIVGQTLGEERGQTLGCDTRETKTSDPRRRAGTDTWHAGGQTLDVVLMNRGDRHFGGPLSVWGEARGQTLGEARGQTAGERPRGEPFRT
jgi:hypothetical protein